MSSVPWRPSIPDGPDGDEPTAARAHRRTELPYTLTAGVGEAAVRHRVFDPALKHFDEAYRPTDDVVPDPGVRARWQTTRRTALDLVLAAVAASPWADSLVLRGSMLMSAWFGPAARAPRDIDFVVVPDTWRIEEPRTRAMLDGIAEAAERLARERGGGLVVSASGAVSEYIWTYERVPGHRLVLPWTAPGLPGGQVQLDFVFNERLPTPALPTEVAGVRIAAASRELSLAWKLMWLGCDMYPQGKDLYDAVLLAESCTMPLELLETVLREADEWPLPPGEPLGPDLFRAVSAEVDWTGFLRDHPDAEAATRHLSTRLLAALGPVFGDR
ncbi:nucleotidyl transferase AbiEii/AbiGii toxin family protein [Streptomyces sp. S1A]|uniref:nucleotidyl transferase AbiEii/AbiGii toxin family protein n=1 Tax=Streptomyces sp. ICN903 TaxID=2964654 RepID=UPI001ED9D22D|nr:nucleotidyl transferase AbiEii/AbiGii toxin family protein [Streptomyces sp. ICN903]MCG3040710.1 nucleotidyl transferase AbiEii/AbiGii toxin family protein [Streptomyces sp. ICN903]